MEEYNDLTEVDLAQDENFIKWAKHPGLYPELDKFWKAWLNRFPHKQTELDAARKMIVAVVEEGDEQNLMKEEEEVWTKISGSLDSNKLPSVRKILIFKVAAGVLILATLLLLLIPQLSKYDFSEPVSQNEMVSVTNKGIAPKTIILDDQSSIILQPKSTLVYPKIFDTKSREVFLSGEAFFEIKKESQRPFLVRADKIVAKVLGTTFTVRAFKDENDILVLVKTGKVSVIVQDGIDKSRIDSSKGGVLLTPNQQAVFSRAEDRISKSLIESPALLNPAVKKEFTFTDVPAQEVFAALEEAYGVDIVFDEELMRGCSLNVTLGDIPLYDKIRLVCKTLEADYEIIDSHIVVTGKGCSH